MHSNMRLMAPMRYRKENSLTFPKNRILDMWEVLLNSEIEICLIRTIEREMLRKGYYSNLRRNSTSTNSAIDKSKSGEKNPLAFLKNCILIMGGMPPNSKNEDVLLYRVIFSNCTIDVQETKPKEKSLCESAKRMNRINLGW